MRGETGSPHGENNEIFFPITNNDPITTNYDD